MISLTELAQLSTLGPFDSLRLLKGSPFRWHLYLRPLMGQCRPTYVGAVRLASDRGTALVLAHCLGGTDEAFRED